MCLNLLSVEFQVVRIALAFGFSTLWNSSRAFFLFSLVSMQWSEAMKSPWSNVLSFIFFRSWAFDLNSLAFMLFSLMCFLAWINWFLEKSIP